MPSLYRIAAAVAAAMIGAQAAPQAQTTTPKGFLVVSAGDTVVAGNSNTITSSANHPVGQAAAGNAPSAPLPITFVNNYSGRPGPGGDATIYAYITGNDGDGAAFFLQQDGKPYYPANPAAGQAPSKLAVDPAIKISAKKGDSITVNLPNYISSGRIYFSVGKMTFGLTNGPKGPVVVAPSFENLSDANIDTNYGFVEFTWNAQEIYSNLSYVDFVGLVASQKLEGSQGTCNVKGLPSDAAAKICYLLAAQGAKDGQPWGKSCHSSKDGHPLRALAPLHLMEMEQTALDKYYNKYIDDVWAKYKTQNLVITGNELGTYTGKVDGSGNLVFDKGGSFAKPTIKDIWGCDSGPFANPTGSDAQSKARAVIVPRLCAAFVRSTLLLPGGDKQPNGINVKDFYPEGVPTDVYGKWIHKTQLDGKGYTFAYDDVSPAGAADQSGACVDARPKKVTFTIGGAD